MVMEAEMGLTSMAMGGNQARYAADDTLLVRFFKHPMENQAKSKEAGRPIFEDADYIEIMQPGNKDSIIRRPATERDKNRFAEHYRKYQVRVDDEHIEGTLLSEWPGISRAQVEELSYMNIKTVEQLASVSDSNAQGILGINALRTRAADYLEAAKEAATTEALADAKRQNEELQELVAELSMKVDVLSNTQPAPKKRGRPKKAPEE